MGLQKLAEGRYRIWVFLGRDAGGRQRRYSEVFRGTKRAAEKREREIRNTLDSGVFVEPRSGTVAQFLQRWLTDYGDVTVTERTAHRYRQIVNLHLIPQLGARKLSELSPLDIEAAKTYWLQRGSQRTMGKGLSARTVNHHLSVLHDALQQAIRWRLLSFNPVDGVAKVRVARARPKALDVDQASRVVRLLDGHEYGRIYGLALATGMRPGEYGGLRWEDVNFHDKRLVVQQGIWQVTRTDVRIVGVKSHRSDRPIALTDEEVNLLREQWRDQERLKAAAGAEWEDWGLVFADDRGRPLDQYRLRRQFGRLLESAGLPKVNLYSLRRTMASIMHALGVPPKVIASRMGHADTAVLFRHYIREFDEQDAQAAEVMAAAIRQAPCTRSAHEEAEDG